MSVALVQFSLEPSSAHLLTDVERPVKRPLRALGSATITVLATLASCAPPETPTAPDPIMCTSDPVFHRTVDFEASPGGTPEVSPDFVRHHHCNLRIVDVREEHELRGELGHLAGSRWVPLRSLARESEGWDPSEAIVLVDRSGRRSGRAAAYLAERGFERAASMTGGILAWVQAGFPTTQVRDYAPTRLAEAPRRHPKGEPLTIEDIEIHIGDPAQVRWTKAATLLLHGTESCVDGREAHAVIGTPGGDAGELLLALATVEALSGRSLDEAEVERLFAGYLEAFGHFYMHTDRHALRALAGTLSRDPLWSGVAIDWRNPGAVEALLRRPPKQLREALLERLTEPSAVGCGHLRLAIAHPDVYGVRPDLVEAVFRAFFERLWRGSDEIELVVLAGEHAEGAVVEVVLDREVEAYSSVPMIAPRHGGTEMFVNHPQVAAFIREQNAAFLFEKLPWLAEGIDRSAFLAELGALAQRQLENTIGHLAADLPIFEVRFEGRTFTVRERALVIPGKAGIQAEKAHDSSILPGLPGFPLSRE
jgi:rhodanese-related sulfurtransferase